MRRRVSSFYREIAEKNAITEERVEELMSWTFDHIVENIKGTTATKITSFGLIRRKPRELLRYMYRVNMYMITPRSPKIEESIQRDYTEIKKLFTTLFAKGRFLSYKKTYDKLVNEIDIKTIEYHANRPT